MIASSWRGLHVLLVEALWLLRLRLSVVARKYEFSCQVEDDHPSISAMQVRVVKHPDFSRVQKPAISIFRSLNTTA